MTSHTESNSGWQYGSSGSIWRGNGQHLARPGFDHDDDNWHKWNSGLESSHDPKYLDKPPPHTLTSSYSSSSFFTSSHPPDSDSNTIYMGNLEPWMDHEYASQVVRLMGWDRSSITGNAQNSPVSIKIPPPPLDAIPQPNNPGYCLITFPNAAQAANVLASLHSVNQDSATAPLLMPNSSRPFNLQWANSSQLPQLNPGAAFGGSIQNSAMFNGFTIHSRSPANSQGPQREFSIFVGDLAPETSNSDLVAVFRNPVLGLRNDREPKFIRPFYSCKSAKIMLDPVTGVSRGYGFVRFTDEADQQRALVEMHGLYCLSRPMRVSPATAKFKPNATAVVPSLTPTPPISLSIIPRAHTPDGTDDCGNVNNDGRVASGPVRSVSSPVASASSVATVNNSLTTVVPAGINNSTESDASSTPTAVFSNSNGKSSSSANGSSPPTQGSARTSDQPTSGHQTQHMQGRQSQGDAQIMPHILAQIAQLASSTAVPQDWSPANLMQQHAGPGIASFPSSSSMTSQPPPYSGQPGLFGTSGSGTGLNERGGSTNAGGPSVYDEAWTHQGGARAILGNLIGPNGEQLTSTDPYNTTVFVGGLSPLISEETLRTFFAPFGDIHYVKVPLGKHCGFVQFVRKADAERAIERMQGFPIGGSRIRLSWGRSQYKAAQAAAQAAQAAQAEQAARLAAAASSAANAQTPASLHMTPDQALQLLQSLGYNAALSSNGESNAGFPSAAPLQNGNASLEHAFSASGSQELPNHFVPSHVDHLQRSAFSPFSPAPFNGIDQQQPQSLTTLSPSQLLPHPSRSYAPGFGPSPSSVSGKYSDTNSPHSSSTESSSGSSVRFSGIGNGSGGFPSAAFLENPNAAFQVNDILRHESQTYLTRVSPSSSLGQDLSTRKTPPRHQHHNQSGLHLKDDTAENEFMQDLNGTLASLDLGERSSRAAIGSEMLKKDGYSHNGERRPLSNSISVPKGFVSPRPTSGGSPDST
ncbi:hypothetical protein K439DRAFT_1379327 [Ramaria rubella]|nr:hypothetical protein K439DRAFT_1379327 [Ramaria rubella]